MNGNAKANNRLHDKHNATFLSVFLLWCKITDDRWILTVQQTLPGSLVLISHFFANRSSFLCFVDYFSSKDIKYSNLICVLIFQFAAAVV